ncbi:SCO2522 family protein [Solihabitans fulvus]|uniref:SCO2522 family protein n=1 Tax=Solihabitans fulvus TaxID=1892852 RepID=UPI001CB76158|nr:SCO2522 family protein [Solihabitans fulvus]
MHNDTVGAAIYSEATEHDQVRAVPLSHLSIEVGHFYMEDLLRGDDWIRGQFQRVAPWVAAATAAVDTGGAKPRVSTCLLMDDYFRNDTSPAAIMDRLVGIAAECDVRIDYVAREAGCCVADDVPLAELTAARLLPEPAPGTNGSRPPAHESGWLCNGERSGDLGSDQAMRSRRWRPPQEFGKRNHSIFLDVEMWKDADDKVNGEALPLRAWSCPFLASVWQLLRLGMLRHYGDAVAQPQQWQDDASWPDRWSELPAVIRLNKHASPFAAYRSMSILPRWYLPIEHAVGVILGHLGLDDAVTEQVVTRGAAEGLRVPRSVTERLSHVFIEGS